MSAMYISTNHGNVKASHFFKLQRKVPFSISRCHNALFMDWLELGTKATRLELGKDPILV